MKPPDFDESAIRSLAADASYYRGEEYYEAGEVSGLTLEGDVYRAYVQGTRRYVVKVWGSEDDIQTSCTCPYDWGGICKHAVAVMLAILRQDADKKPVKRPPAAKPAEPVPVEDILTALSAEALRKFVRLQISEYQNVAENLQIFSQGAAETGKSVEDYEVEITAALKSGDFSLQDEDDDYGHGRYEDFREEEEEGDTVEGILQPYRDTARKYQAQGNWIESAKIHEAILHACGKMAGTDRDEKDDEIHDEDEDEDEDGDEGEDEGEEEEDEDEEVEIDFRDGSGYVEEACLTEAQSALSQWAAALAEATPKKDKGRMLERFVTAFAKDPYSLGPEKWEDAFKNAVCAADEAKVALAHLSRLKVKRLDQDPEKAGALLHLLNLSGDTARFVKVGKNAIHHHPHLALPLGEKLIQMDRRSEAIHVAEAALKRTKGDRYWPSDHEAREPLLRFLTRTYDPGADYKRLIECTKTLLFENNRPSDYTFLRDLLKSDKERETLIQEVKAKCSAEALIRILSKEKRWEDLLDCARRHTQDTEFPRMIKLLRERFPAECFKLYRKTLWDIVDSGTGNTVYRSAAFHARQVKEIPGHEGAFAELMADVVDKYSRRSGLMSALGDLAELGRAWKDRTRRERFEKMSSGPLKKMNLDELIELCPIQESDREKLKGTHVAWQRSNAALVWAILTARGGKMDAADITEAIAQHRGCQQTSASATRSGSLKMLEALGYVKIKREGQHLREVRLVKDAEKKS